MSLFLSKLLPLFLYPLGFACVMLVLALFSVWKRPRWTAGYITLALLALLLGGNGAVARQLTYSLERQYVPTALPNAGAIVVLGDGIRSQFPPRPWIDVTEAGDRPIYAAALYKQGKAPLVILSGGRIDWLGGGSPESPESADMAKLVEALGVPASAILQDPTSLNTRENAVNVKQILDARGIQQILLVTSATHMPRSMRIFQKLGINATAAPTDFLVVQPEVELAGKSPEGRLLGLIPDSEHLHHSTRALKEYIGSFVYQLRGWI
ncbi:MAG: YdcF family protein [Pegethrix bostrychoides GSE-TBD4-15B]|jgi:uncharacterized SAM-binding protein YcdF (DUF218 family)|uniref:YdcF family protein n=1 Tax=Pegethrix bostrychoides GSE-TBD4-15B TaxID=2839662 RepID=A0A951U4A3_9CYAN|nr:YdcF family protein [Pegethrix bostrychoides GSE-TBD4-15B]